MINSEREKTTFNSTNLIEFLYYWRKPLLITTLAAIIASVIFSSPTFITPKFKSTVIMFPTSSNSISKALLAENVGSKNDILEFGEDEQAEQMLQILNSSDIREKIVQKYKLMGHYNIDSNSKFKYTKLFTEYESNISFRRTEYMAVEISVLDKDPQMAADIANDISALLDSTKNKMQKERAIQGYKIVETEYFKLRDEIKSMEDSLTSLRKLGVHDYETQAEMINQQLAIEIAKGNSRGVKALEDKLNVLAIYGGPYVSIRDALEHEKKQLSTIKAKYEESKVDAEQILPQKFVVNKAYKAEKKSYPVRWLIVMVSTLSTFLLIVLIIMVLDNLPAVRLQKKNLVFRNPFKPIVFTLPLIDMDNFFNNLNLFKLIIKWKWHLLFLGLAGVLLAVIFSSPFFIKPKFKSFAIIYPSNISPYSDESESEQMLQILNSKDIRDSIIKKFDLATHYGIDPSYKYFYSTLMREYSQNVNIKKTEFEAVNIEVIDADAQIASDMISAMIDFYNKKIRSLQKQKFWEVVVNFKQILDKKKNSLDSVQKAIDDMGSNYGLVDYASQSREMTRGYLRTTDGSGSSRINTPEVLKLKDNMEKKGGEFLMLQSLAQNEARTYADLNARYTQAMLDYNREYTYVNIVSPPYPADKKAYPVRWLIVTVTLLATFFVSLVFITVMEKSRMPVKVE